MVALIAAALCLIGINLLVRTGALSERDETELTPIFTAILGAICVLASVVIMHFVGFKEGQVDALQNKWQYEEHYVYRDTVCIDTLYVKIK